jgi:C-terminal processing protease CtpA/Prc
MRLPPLLILALCLTASTPSAEIDPPAPAVDPVVDQVELMTSTGRPYLGVKLDEAASETTPGVVVQHVFPGSAAADAGVLVGDIIHRINGQDIRSPDHLKAAIDGVAVGTKFSIGIRRGEQAQEITATMKRLPSHGRLIDQMRQAQNEIARLQQQKGSLGRGDDDVGLAMAMQMLATAMNEFPERLQGAAKEFKRVYPQGTFAIRIEIDVRSDATVKDPVDLSPAAAPKDPAPAAPAPATP